MLGADLSYAFKIEFVMRFALCDIRSTFIFLA